MLQSHCWEGGQGNSFHLCHLMIYAVNISTLGIVSMWCHWTQNWKGRWYKSTLTLHQFLVIWKKNKTKTKQTQKFTCACLFSCNSRPYSFKKKKAVRRTLITPLKFDSRPILCSKHLCLCCWGFFYYKNTFNTLMILAMWLDMLWRENSERNFCLKVVPPQS